MTQQLKSGQYRANCPTQSKALAKHIIKAKRRYVRVPELRRQQLLELIEDNCLTVKAAAQKLGINYSTAKTIAKTIGRMGRKTPLLRTSRDKTEVMKGRNEVISKGIRDNQIQIEQVNTQNLTPKVVPQFEGNTDIFKSSKVPVVFDFSIYTYMMHVRYFNCNKNEYVQTVPGYVKV